MCVIREPNCGVAPMHDSILLHRTLRLPESIREKRAKEFVMIEFHSYCKAIG